MIAVFIFGWIGVGLSDGSLSAISGKWELSSGHPTSTGLFGTRDRANGR